MRVFLGIVLFVAVLAAFSERDLQPAPAHAEPPLPELVDISHLERVAETGLPQPTEFERLVSEPATPTQVVPSFVESVYPVRVRGISTDPQTYGRQVISDGSAVAVTAEKLHTAKHLIDRISGYAIEVKVGSEFIAARGTPFGQKDLLVLTVARPVLKPAPVRAPEYGERVTIYGLTTKSLAQGRYAGDINHTFGQGLVPLEPDQTTVDQGDSGGGVFGDDGSLLGTVTGLKVDSPLVVGMTPIVSDAAPAPAAPANLVTPAPNLATPPMQSGNCPGGVCQQQPSFTAPRVGRRVKR